MQVLVPHQVPVHLPLEWHSSHCENNRFLLFHINYMFDDALSVA